MTEFLTGLLRRCGGMLAAIAAGVLGLLAVWFGGKRRGANEERVQTEARINEQAAQARQEVRDVQDALARKSDDAIADELERDWVRK